MKYLLKKLGAASGETLVETLASILIFTLASIVMFSMVTAALRLNTQVREWDARIQRQMVAAERADRQTGSGTVTIQLDDSILASVAVEVYGGVDEAGSWKPGTLFSFFVSCPPGGEE